MIIFVKNDTKFIPLHIIKHVNYYELLFVRYKRTGRKMFDTLIKQFKQAKVITEQFKEDNRILWVQKMKNIQSIAIEIINNELIYS